MTNCIAWATGYDKSGRIKEVSRLGSASAEGQAKSWLTTAKAWVNADGSGMVSVIRDGKLIHEFAFGPEG